VSLLSQSVSIQHLHSFPSRRSSDLPETRHTCMKHLDEQLKKMQPALIFCMGNVSVQSFFDDEKVDVKSLRGHWHDVRGISTAVRSEEHTYELQSRFDIVCLLLLEKK